MNPDPTITITCDYLLELSDDGKQSDQPEPEVITLPPSPNGEAPSPAPARLPE